MRKTFLQVFSFYAASLMCLSETQVHKRKKNLNIRMNFQLPSRLVTTTVNEAKGRIFKRKDGKYLIYIPVDLAEDSMFPFQTNSAVPVKISFKVGDDKLNVEKWKNEKTS